MIFKEDITKSEIQQLPLLKYDGNIKVIDTEDQLQEAYIELKEERIIGFDTEKKPTFQKGQYHPTALVQLSSLSCAYLIRISEIGVHHLLLRLFENDSISKVGISIKDDIVDLQKIRNFDPQNFIDLNDVASEMGIRREGVRNLTAIFLEQRVSKSQQTSNWETENLSRAQKLYAATDAWVCAYIFNLLESKGYLSNGIE